ncbi:MAG: magnesium/cobalt transporter CorA [Nannocystaceae bacterium]
MTTPNPHPRGPVDKALDLAAGAGRNVGRNVVQYGRAVGAALRLPGWGPAERVHHPRVPGAASGIEHLPEIDTPPDPSTIRIRVIDYAPERVEEHAVELDQLEAWLSTDIPAWITVRWINVDGLHPWVVERFRQALSLHTLSAEDVLHVPQRPALEHFSDHLFVKARLLMMVGDKLVAEHVSLFVHERTLVSFQEREGDVWEPLRERIRREGSAIRGGTTGFLMYAMLDAAVDHCFPLLERYGDMLEDLEDAIMLEVATPQLLRVQQLRRELLAIRRVLWPTRELVDALQRDEAGRLPDSTRTYIRDVYSHVVQLIDILEAQREMCSGLSELYMSQVSNRMNEIMKVLTIMSSLFIPVTFLAGVYGMNFEHIPELHWAFAYPVFWAVCVTAVVSLLWLFRRRGWL